MNKDVIFLLFDITDVVFLLYRDFLSASCVGSRAVKSE